jgi:energy-coupling factor transporter ATP-binding protein EcfA2
MSQEYLAPLATTPAASGLALAATGLSVSYAGVKALDSVDFAVAPGSFTLVGGPSGAGKSSLALALAGLIQRTNGSRVTGGLWVNGADPGALDPAQLSEHIGLVFQNPATQLFNESVQEEVAFGPVNQGLSPEVVCERVEYALHATRTAHLRNRVVRRLSGGEKQLVAIASVLAMRPRILVLDEPTANLDTQGGKAIAEALAQLHSESGVTIVLIEHRMELFEPYADSVLWLNEGRVAAHGAPANDSASAATHTHIEDRKRARSGETLVDVRDVSAGYDRSNVLQNCSMRIRCGDFAALVGNNGAGKSTVARVLSGLLHPRRGKVIWHTEGARQRVGLLQQNPLHQLVCGTVRDEIEFGPRNLGHHSRDRTDRLLVATDLSALEGRSTMRLSVGEQQRVALASTLSLRPALLILDEPTIGQDWRHLQRTMDYVEQRNRAGQTVLLITHDARLVERYPNRIWELHEGRIERVQ